MPRAISTLVFAKIVAFVSCSDRQLTNPPETVGLQGRRPPSRCLLPDLQDLADTVRSDIATLFSGKNKANAPTQHLNNIERKLCDEDYDALKAWGFFALVNGKLSGALMGTRGTRPPSGRSGSCWRRRRSTPSRR